jgi:hypothetical protein
LSSEVNRSRGKDYTATMADDNVVKRMDAVRVVSEWV